MASLIQHCSVLQPALQDISWPDLDGASLLCEARLFLVIYCSTHGWSSNYIQFSACSFFFSEFCCLPFPQCYDTGRNASLHALYMNPETRARPRWYTRAITKFSRFSLLHPPQLQTAPFSHSSGKYCDTIPCHSKPMPHCTATARLAFNGTRHRTNGLHFSAAARDP